MFVEFCRLVGIWNRMILVIDNGILFSDFIKLWNYIKYKMKSKYRVWNCILVFNILFVCCSFGLMKKLYWSEVNGKV